MVETAPWEQKPDVIALESLQKVVPEALTEKAAKRTVGKNQIGVSVRTIDVNYTSKI